MMSRWSHRITHCHQIDRFKVDSLKIRGNGMSILSTNLTDNNKLLESVPAGNEERTRVASKGSNRRKPIVIVILSSLIKSKYICKTELEP
jgi:hypothetical protein